MNAYALIGAVIAAIAYIPLTRDVWRKTLIQNFATYFLWGLLDAIATASTLIKGGNFLLPAIYVVLSWVICFIILRTRTFKWTWFESMTSGLVIICIIVWATIGNAGAIIASTIAVVIAGAPQLKDFWNEPGKAPIRVYAGFTVANGISILAGHNWSVEERFYSSVTTILTLLFVIVAARRWLPQFRQQPA